jgi:hypothetical protein
LTVDGLTRLQIFTPDKERWWFNNLDVPPKKRKLTEILLTPHSYFSHVSSSSTWRIIVRPYACSWQPAPPAVTTAKPAPAATAAKPAPAAAAEIAVFIAQIV